MANVNITLRRNNGTDWDYLYPKTTVDQITDLSTVGENLITKGNPTVDSFVQIEDGGAVNYLTAAQLKTAIGASDASHTHPISDVSGLQTALNGKANLSGGFISSSEIPDFLFSGLRFIAPKSSGVTLSSLYSEIDGSTDAEKQGGYFVASADITVTTGSGHTLGYGGDDGDETASGTTIEKGDWLVYSGSNTWAVVNNTYRLADTDSLGIVSLSTGINTLRSQLASSSDGTKVMDEKAVKTVMKDIFYQSSSPTGSTGDLWFQGTFA